MTWDICSTLVTIRAFCLTRTETNGNVRPGSPPCKAVLLSSTHSLPPVFAAALKEHSTDYLSTLIRHCANPVNLDRCIFFSTLNLPCFRSSDWSRGGNLFHLCQRMHLLPITREFALPAATTENYELGIFFNNTRRSETCVKSAVRNRPRRRAARARTKDRKHWELPTFLYDFFFFL